MKRVLLVRLRGPMQAWGDHTYEDYRPTRRHPTRSGLTGLLAACMGVDRQDAARLEALNASFGFAVAAERDGQLTVDFHTVLSARKADGKPREDAILSRREYLHDASFLVALEARDGATVSLDEISEALRSPVFTPFLGRRSCPLSEPLFVGWCEAESALSAIQERLPKSVALSETEDGSPNRARVRDVGVYGRIRQFGVRDVFIHPPRVSDEHALSEQDPT